MTMIDDVKTKSGRYAAENGNINAIEKFSKELRWSVPGSSQKLQASLPQGSKVLEDPDKVLLKEKVCGRPLMLGELDSLVQDYVKQLRLSEGIVSTCTSILVACC